MNKKGQALVEYILIIALISIVVISAVSVLGGVLKDKLTESTCSLVGESFVKGAKAGEGKCVENN